MNKHRQAHGKGPLKEKDDDDTSTDGSSTEDIKTIKSSTSDSESS